MTQNSTEDSQEEVQTEVQEDVGQTGGQSTEMTASEAVDGPLKPADSEVSPGQLIQTAVESGADVQKLQKLFELKKEVDAENARKEFTQAMAVFQKHCPTIEKTRTVKNNGKVVYKYAPLADVVDTISPALAKAGLSFSWKTSAEQIGDSTMMVKAVAEVTHEAGHTETTSFSVPVSGGNNMTSKPQEYGKALTYAKRYSLTSALGVSAGEDTDAVKNNDEKPLDIRGKIMFLLKELGRHSNDKEEVKETIEELTDLDITNEDQHEEIKNRLVVLVNEQNADEGLNDTDDNDINDNE